MWRDGGELVCAWGGGGSGGGDNNGAEEMGEEGAGITNWYRQKSTEAMAQWPSCHAMSGATILT